MRQRTRRRAAANGCGRWGAAGSSGGAVSRSRKWRPRGKVTRHPWRASLATARLLRAQQVTLTRTSEEGRLRPPSFPTCGGAPHQPRPSSAAEVATATRHAHSSPTRPACSARLAAMRPNARVVVVATRLFESPFACGQRKGDERGSAWAPQDHTSIQRCPRFGAPRCTAWPINRGGWGSGSSLRVHRYEISEWNQPICVGDAHSL